MGVFTSHWCVDFFTASATLQPTRSATRQGMSLRGPSPRQGCVERHGLSTSTGDEMYSLTLVGPLVGEKKIAPVSENPPSQNDSSSKHVAYGRAHFRFQRRHWPQLYLALLKI